MEKRITWLVFICILLSACSGQKTGSSGIAAGASGQVLFQDDFSSTAGGWDTWNGTNGSAVGYSQGGLRIYINEAQFDYWSRPGKRLSDVRLEVDATKLSGPDDNDFGLICRFQDKDNYYSFLISSDGYGGIIRVKDGKFAILTGKTMTFSDVIQRGGGANHLRADCNGPNLVLSVNQTKILEAQDTSFTMGEVGIIAGSTDKPGVDILFDNFIIYNP